MSQNTNKDSFHSNGNRKYVSRSKSAGERFSYASPSFSYRKRAAVDNEEEEATSSSSPTNIYPHARSQLRDHHLEKIGSKHLPLIPSSGENGKNGDNNIADNQTLRPGSILEDTRRATCSPVSMSSNASSTDSVSADYPYSGASGGGSRSASDVNGQSMSYLGGSSPTLTTDSDDSGSSNGGAPSADHTVAPPGTPLKRLRLSSESSGGSPINFTRRESVSSQRSSSALLGETLQQRRSSSNNVGVENTGAGSDAEREAPDGRKRRFLKTADILRKSGLLHVTLKTADLIKANEILDKEIAQFKREVQELMNKVSNPSTTGSEKERVDTLTDAEQSDSEENADDVTVDYQDDEKEEEKEESVENRASNVVVRSKKHHRCAKYGGGDEVKDNKSVISYKSLDSGMGTSVISDDAAMENQF